MKLFKVILRFEHHKDEEFYIMAKTRQSAVDMGEKQCRDASVAFNSRAIDWDLDYLCDESEIVKIK